MPRSVLLGRPWPQPGEPLFTDEDTAYAIALAEEERDTCPSCGMPKVVCRDPQYQVAFDVHEETCWPTWRLAQHRGGDKWKSKHDGTKQATLLSAVFREGHAAPIDAGLDVDGQHHEAADYGSGER